MLITKHYTIQHDWAHMPRWPKYQAPRKSTNVYIHIVGPYNEGRKLHTHHKRKRVFTLMEDDRKTVVGHHRTRQVDRWCQMVGADLKISVD